MKFTLFAITSALMGASAVDHSVSTTLELHNKVSNSDIVGTPGNAIMASGDTAVMAVGDYKCTTGTCDGQAMIDTKDLFGEIRCASDDASCVLDGENEYNQRGMYILKVNDGSAAQKLTVRAVTIKDCKAQAGGGLVIENYAIVDIVFCVFSNCEATGESEGGGAILIYDQNGATPGAVNIYGTSFNGNKAGANNADDIIVEAGTVTIDNTCPSPYESTTPYKGTALDITGTIGGTAKSFSCVVCPTGLVGTVPNCSTKAPTSAPTAAPVDLDNGSLRTTTNFVVGVISALTLAGFFIEGF